MQGVPVKEPNALVAGLDTGGKKICENAGLTESTCAAASGGNCCHYDHVAKECISSVGSDPCPTAPDKLCHDIFAEDLCALDTNCEWHGDVLEVALNDTIPSHAGWCSDKGYEPPLKPGEMDPPPSDPYSVDSYFWTLSEAAKPKLKVHQTVMLAEDVHGGPQKGDHVTVTAGSSNHSSKLHHSSKKQCTSSKPRICQTATAPHGPAR